MPDFTAGNNANATTIENADPGGRVAPHQIDQPSEETPANVQGSKVITATEAQFTDPNYQEGHYISAGQDPADRVDHSEHGNDYPLPKDTPGGDAPRGKQSFSDDNDEAVPVFQRADEAWTGETFIISGPTQVVRRMKGRTSVTLYVPSTDQAGNAVNGIVYAPDAGQVQGIGLPLFLLPGMSVTLHTEAPVWASVIGANATGFVCVVTTDNPAGGQLGGL
jgi:hypothetical protein